MAILIDNNTKITRQGVFGTAPRQLCVRRRVAGSGPRRAGAVRFAPFAPLGLVVLVLSGCVAASPSSPELIELSNIKPSHIVPKSSPAQLVSAFRRYCLADTLDDARQALRKDDYIQKPRRGRSAVHSYVVDSRKPAVLLSGEAERFNCAVLAEARTGQTSRIEDFVTAGFPKLAEADPARLGPRTERAWLAAGANGGIVFTKRAGPRITPQYLMFGILRPEPS